MIAVQNYINGKLCPAKEQHTLDFENPALGKVIGTCPSSSSDDVRLAIESAKDAHESWRALDCRERADYLYRISEKILAKTSEFALAETLNTGKLLKSSREIDIPRSALNFKFFAELSAQWHSEYYPSSANLEHKVLRPPLGVVACISPWNLPLYLLSWKIAPALAAGNCVIAKPSEITPLTAFLLSEVCIEIGLPPGVLNVVHGLGPNIGPTLCQSQDIKALSFTGSTQTGKVLAQQCAPYFKKLSLEMGGKNASLVFADANLEKASDEILRAAFSNQGQICLCGSRILIEKSIYNSFKALLLQKISKWKCGSPEDPHARLGAITSRAHFEKISTKIQSALSRGALALSGAHPVQLPTPFENGYYYSPTLLEGLDKEDSFLQEEIFGPVATLQSFESDEEAIALANNSSYGLSASVWTNSLTRSHRISQSLEVGMLWINTWMARDLRTPFGGLKNSGLGREGGTEALRFFTETKTISTQF